MRRIFLVNTLLAGLIAGLGLTGAPAEAAVARARVKVVVTSLSGAPILVRRFTGLCNSTRHIDRLSQDNCRFELVDFTTRRYQRTLRVTKTHLAEMIFESDSRFRMRLYVNGIKMHDRRAHRHPPVSGEREWVLGFIFLGPGAINLV